MKQFHLSLSIFLAICSSTFAQNDEAQVKEVLKAYKNALEALDVSNTSHLYTSNAAIFENGSVEGTYQDYLDHHIGPELGHFQSFSFSDYHVEVEIASPYAFATETYFYNIVLEDGTEVVRQGLATSVLKKIDSKWHIIKMHNSSRKPKKK